MKETGTVNKAYKADQLGLKPASVFWNQPEAVLYEAAVSRGEAKIVAGGPLVAETGQHTGRSAKDKFIVRDDLTNKSVWWDNNAEMSAESFEVLFADMLKHAETKELFAQDLYGGANPAYRLNVRVYTEKAWHALFIRHLLIRPAREDLNSFVPQMTIINLPSFKADPKRHGCRTETVIACDFSRKIVLIAGTSYAGEMKKSVFTMLNFTLPMQDVMPMHCSANTDEDDGTAIFFGLSGTGKTTLSADAKRTLIGDDEHGWGKDGVFNFEGGCYAKMIRLSEMNEPEIYAAVNRFPAVLENVTIDPETRKPNFDDGSKTENTRGAYPIEFIPNASKTGKADHPNNIIMLTADAFGVLPPIAKLSPAQAMYHFLSGYTAKIAGTERGITEPQATFSTCFGAPFMPRNPAVYGELLKKLIAEHDVDCWLVNTGWTGGAYGTGERMPIKVTRMLLTAALNGSLAKTEFRVDPVFGFAVPVHVEGVVTKTLNPRETWADGAAYDTQAAKLARMFQDNFQRFEQDVTKDIREAAPSLRAAAE
ncbi:MAG: phosphoenolpyruvate carboxykinase [Pseudomonadota bacterium]